MNRYEVAKLESVSEARMATAYLQRHGLDARLVEDDLVRGSLLSPRIKARFGISAPVEDVAYAKALLAMAMDYGDQDERTPCAQTASRPLRMGQAQVADLNQVSSNPPSDAIRMEMAQQVSKVSSEIDRMLLTICAFGIFALVLIQVWALSH